MVGDALLRSSAEAGSQFRIGEQQDQLGYRLKRTGYPYLQARAEAARRFQRRLKKLRDLGPAETVVFQNETGFTLHPHLGRT